MTEKLTYDPTPADAPELSEDEQNSLEVAEKLGQEENELILGKFKNAEELELAYAELEKKLGQDADEDTEVDTEQDEPEEEVSPAVSLITNASEEYYSNEGQISEETMSKFTEMSSTDLVNAYMEIQKNNPTPTAESEDLTDSEMNQVYNSAGGEAAYQDLLSWAGENISDNKLNAFNSIIDKGDATAIQIAVAGLRNEYDNSEGHEGKMLQGKASKSSGDAFRSQAEVVSAMSDPRYDRDPAYRQDLYDKLERSNVAF